MSEMHLPPDTQPVAEPRTNGLAIAPMVLGIIGGSILAIIFGHVSLKQISRTGERGRGMAIAGLWLGYGWLAAWVLIWISILGSAAAINPYDPDYSIPDSVPSAPANPLPEPPLPAPVDPATAELDALYDSCADGDMADCDQLWWESPSGSSYEMFGDTCGDRQAPGVSWCVDRVEPSITTDLDVLYAECDEIGGYACDLLFMSADEFSEQWLFGSDCGGRGFLEGAGIWCSEEGEAEFGFADHATV